MGEQENMVRAWTITLMSVLNGLMAASMAMERAGETRRIVEVSMEVMRDIMPGHTLAQKQLLSKQLDLLCRLANEG